MESMDLLTLREDLTCSVCLDIPRSGDIFQCHNGHLICQSDYNKLLAKSATAICPECRASYGPNPINSRFAQKFLDLVKLPCRNVERGCSVKLTRKQLGEHEMKDCKFALRICRYNSNGCQEQLNNDLVTKHEDDCMFRPYPCVIMACASRLPCSKMLSHFKSCHLLEFRDDDAARRKKEVSCTGVFLSDGSMPVPWSQRWSQWKGSVFKFDGRLFYLGLTRMGAGRCTASVHLIDRPSEVSNYWATITAGDPKRKDRHVKYEGPVNSLLVAGQAGFEEGVVGLSIPGRIARDLKHSFIFQDKTALIVQCTISRI